MKASSYKLKTLTDLLKLSINQDKSMTEKLDLPMFNGMDKRKKASAISRNKKRINAAEKLLALLPGRE